MAIQSPFFGKREDNPSALRPGTPQARNLAGTGITPPAGASLTAADSYAAPAMAASSPLSPSPSAPSTPPVASPAPADMPPAMGGSRLTVGPNIKLKGVEITDCDTLFVEGTVEATMDSRLMQIAEGGAFKGSAEIDIAEIHGAFDGNLTVREKLVIHATGKVTGSVRYGKLVIQEGGQISGEIHVGMLPKEATSTVRSGLQAA